MVNVVTTLLIATAVVVAVVTNVLVWTGVNITGSDKVYVIDVCAMVVIEARSDMLLSVSADTKVGVIPGMFAGVEIYIVSVVRTAVAAIDLEFFMPVLRGVNGVLGVTLNALTDTSTGVLVVAVATETEAGELIETTLLKFVISALWKSLSLRSFHPAITAAARLVQPLSESTAPVSSVFDRGENALLPFLSPHPGFCSAPGL